MKLSDEIIDCLSIDCIIFGFKKAKLYVLLVKHGQGQSKGGWALPGGWIKYNESTDAAAQRILSAQTAVSKIFLEQFKTYGELNRFPGKRVITVTYYALVNTEDFELHPGITVTEARWFEVSTVPSMVFDHSRIYKECFLFLKHKVRHEPIGFNLLPRKFTLTQLQELYEAVLDTKLDKGNFRRKLTKMNLLVDCHEKQEDVQHRKANLFRFDKKVYDTLLNKGLIFEL